MSDATSSAGKLAEELAGKRAIVTGGGSGIGRAIATALARHGVRITIADLDPNTAKTVAAELGNGARAVAIDVRKRASVETAFNDVISAWGGFDILIANAGVSTMNKAVDLTDEEWDFNFDVNTRGIFLTNQIAARHFIATSNRGVIVNTASLAAKIGAPLLAHYS